MLWRLLFWFIVHHLEQAAFILAVFLAFLLAIYVFALAGAELLNHGFG